MLTAEKNTLFLFTNEFPCSKTLEPYLEHEILFLAKAFKKVIIIPTTINTVQKSIPANVEVINIFDNKWFKSDAITMLICLPSFVKFYLAEIFDKKSRSKLYIKNFISDYKSFYNAIITGNAIQSFAKLKSIDLKQSAFYSFWFFHPVLSLSILKNKNVISSFISRGHLGDIYLDQFPELSNFFNYKIKNISKLLLISTHAKNYIDKLYPALHEKFVVSRLAVSNMGLNPNPQSDFVLVSCSTYSPRKRVDLLAKLLCDAPFPITWYHFGFVPNDVLKRFDENFLKTKAPVKAIYKGDVPNHSVMDFYKANPVNVIVNLSTSEGLPFSLIEATSFGIPTIATDVNGTSDIATTKNGFLLPQQFGAALFYECLIKIKENGEVYRKGARELFEEKYNSLINYEEVISYLKK